MKNKEFLISQGVNIEKSLELFGDIETYNDVIQDFLKDMPDKVNNLKECKEKSDMENYAIIAHSLKSDARYFGFDYLGELAYQHELKGKESDMNYITEHFDTLMNEVNKVTRIVREYLGMEVQSTEVGDSAISGVKSKTILVVDDSNIVRSFIQKVFNDTYDVLIASDGNEALNIIKENNNNHKIIGMLLDLNMPNTNGFEVLDFFKENGLFAKIPVSIITGEASREMVQKAFEYPIVDMLNKPFNEQDVKRIVERIILFSEAQ